MRLNHFPRIIWLSLAALAFEPIAVAQSPGYLTNSNNTGMPDYGSFIASQIDSVNLASGGLSIRIPFQSRKGRGFDYSEGWRYESKFWVVDRYILEIPPQPPSVRFAWRPSGAAGMWTYVGNLGGSVEWAEQLYTCAPSNQSYPPVQLAIRSNWTLTMADGTTYQFPLRKIYIAYQYPGTICSDEIASTPQMLLAQSNNGQTEIDITNDGYTNRSVKVRFKNGGKVGSWGDAFSVKDTNGNWCCLYQTGQYFDTLGRATAFKDSSGNPVTPTTESQSLTTNTTFPTAGPGMCNFDQDTFPVPGQQLKKITIPNGANGLSYNISYEEWYYSPNPTRQNPFAEITKITLPTGGYIKYKWGTIAGRDPGPEPGPPDIGCAPNLDARVLLERRVSEDGTNEQVWTYSYTSQATTVTDPLGNIEVHTFGVSFGHSPLETQVEYKNSSGVTLRKVNTDWAMDSGPTVGLFEYIMPTVPFKVDSRNPRVIRTTTTLSDSNQVTKTESDYGDCFSYTAYYNNYTDCRENATEIREHGYGSGAFGALARKTTLTYLHTSNSNYLNAHIWDRVSEKKVFDAAGNMMANAQFVYDSTSITSTSGVPQHDYTNYSSSYTVRGNVSQVKRWNSTTSAWLTTTNTYNDVGNLIQTADPGNHTTTFSYADNFSDGVNRSSQAYVTQVTYPTTSGVSHIEKKQYYWYSGLTAAGCGQNFSSSCVKGLTGTQPDYAWYNYDLLGRPYHVFQGHGGQTTFAFNESSLPINVSSTTKIDDAQNLVNTAVIDGLGRVKQTQLNSDPAGTVYVDTTFDTLGRKLTVSNPHRSTSAQTDGITSFEYDALGRVTKVIPPDGSFVTTGYSGNSTTVTDQAGKQRRSFTDALGRLIQVDEPYGNPATAGAGSATVNGSEQNVPAVGATPGTGSVTISGTEQSVTVQEQVGEECVLYGDEGCLQWQPVYQWVTYYDSGTVSVITNGSTKSVSYGTYSTASSIASALVSAINADSNYPVSASLNGTVVNLTAKTSGASTNYSLSASSSTNDPAHFGSPSFTATRSGPTLTGGGDAHGIIYDAGSVWVTVNGATKTVSYGQTSTSSTIASALASAINGDGTYPVTASVNGAAISVTARGTGSGTNYSLSGGSSTSQSSWFSQPSFTVQLSGSTLSGGMDAGSGTLSTPAVTLYTYDALDNLTCVAQKGFDTSAFSTCASAPAAWRPRSFTYNSLSQLTQAYNPESGTNSYAYDPDGYLTSKTDARNITITHAYDALHRLTGKTYSNGDAAAAFTYDVSSIDGLSIQYPMGRMVKAAQGSTRTVQSYDVAGRIINNWQCTPLNCGSSWFNLTYIYNYVGGATSYTDGVGHTFSQTFNGAVQITLLTSSLNDAQHPGTLATDFSYFAAGAVQQMKFGNGVYGRVDMNNRLQPCRMRTNAATTSEVLCASTDPTGDILQFKYGYGASGANNGNVTSWAASGSAGQSFTRSYTYEELNRLKTMTSTGTCTGLSWTYDIWANRTHQTITGGTCGQSQLTINTLNRIADTGYTYDAAGNLTGEPGKTYQHDAEGRMTSINNGCPSTTCYVYNTAGQRVRKIASGTTTEYVYNLGGSVVAEKVGTTWTKGYVYLGGQLLAQYSNSTTYFAHKDHLGSTRLLTKMDKNPLEAPYDYLPYGEPIGSSGAGTTHKFTGKERDAESGLDYFIARYYSAGSGRFTSTDRAASKLVDPQTLNRYSYVRNNPVQYVDPDGNFSAAIHRQITNTILDQFGYSRAVTQSLSDYNISVDSLYQDEAHAYMHSQGRRINGRQQTAVEARREERAYVDLHVSDAAGLLLNGFFEGARQFLGEALHAVQDEKHEWTPFSEHQGKLSDLNNPNGRMQLSTDKKPSLEQIEQAERRTRETILQFESQVRTQGRNRGMRDGEIEMMLHRFRYGLQPLN